MKRLTAMLVMLAVSLSALAYDKDSGHPNLTQIAINLVNSCADRVPDLKPYHINRADYLIDLNVGEDNVTWSRLRDWHFYNPDRHGYRWVWILFLGWVDQSLYRTYSSIAYYIENPPDSGAVFYYTGRALHYVEDMAVPAHIIPVFHPGWPYGDSIDKYPLSSEKLEGQLLSTMTDDKCLKLAHPANVNGTSPSEEVWAILNHNRNTVLDFIDGPIDPDKCGAEFKWKDLWLPPPALALSNYFGDYPLFNPPEPIIGLPLPLTVVRKEGTECRIDSNRLNIFISRLHETAILGDMKLLFLAGRISANNTLEPTRLKSPIHIDSHEPRVISNLPVGYKTLPPDQRVGVLLQKLFVNVDSLPSLQFSGEQTQKLLQQFVEISSLLAQDLTQLSIQSNVSGHLPTANVMKHFTENNAYGAKAFDSLHGGFKALLEAVNHNNFGKVQQIVIKRFVTPSTQFRTFVQRSNTLPDAVDKARQKLVEFATGQRDFNTQPSLSHLTQIDKVLKSINDALPNLLPPPD